MTWGQGRQDEPRLTMWRQLPHRYTPHPIGEVASAALAGLDPRLTGAACVGLSPMFDAYVAGEDPDARRERLATAQGVCRGCPVQRACRELGEGEQLGGIWGGVLIPYYAAHLRNKEKAERNSA